MTFTPNAPHWPEERMDNIGRNGNDGEHYVPTQPVDAPREVNPTSSSLTDSQACEIAIESGTCIDGTQCGAFAETAYCEGCPNQPKVLTRRQMIDRCNAILAFWPNSPEGAQRVMPVDYPWRWDKDDYEEVVLLNPRSLVFVTEADWKAGEDLSELTYKPDDAALKQSANAHYQRTYKGVLFDPYRIAAVWRMQGGPREQIMKKCLRFTEKGQTEQEVVNEIRSALNRWQEMLDEDKNNG